MWAGLYASESWRRPWFEFLSFALCSGIWGASDSDELRAGKAVHVQRPGLLSGEADKIIAKTSGPVTRGSSFSVWNSATDNNSEMLSCWGKCHPLGLDKRFLAWYFFGWGGILIDMMNNLSLNAYSLLAQVQPLLWFSTEILYLIKTITKTTKKTFHLK